MRSLAMVAVFLWPAITFAEQSYSNSDLVRFHVPGAFTNEDLKKVSVEAGPKGKVVTVPAPVAFALPEIDTRRFQDEYDGLLARRVRLSADLAIERQRIEFSESAFAGDTSTIAPRLGYRARVASLVLELEKRIAILDVEMDAILETARKERFSIDRRSR